MNKRQWKKHINKYYLFQCKCCHEWFVPEAAKIRCKEMGITPSRHENVTPICKQCMYLNRHGLAYYGLYPTTHFVL